jgi:hypothetical protein
VRAVFSSAPKIASAVLALLLSSCASFNYIHDPQAGTVSREALPEFFKSLRCELITYYQATYRRRDLYKRARATNPEDAAANYSYFDLDDGLYGLFYLDLKVVDTLGLATGTAIDNKKALSSTASQTWHFGPSVGVTDTYELNWSFAIKQDAGFETLDGDLRPLPGNAPYPRTLQCYSSIPQEETLDGLAAGNHSELEQFKRIYVNGSKPLAYWLLQNGELMAAAATTSRKDITRPKLTENAIFTGQMVYSFIVQVSGGLDVKFSLLTNVWNPLAGDVSGGVAQTNTLFFYINGSKSAVASNAKGGNALIYPSPVRAMPVVIQEQPIQVIPPPGKKPAAANEGKGFAKPEGGPPPPATDQNAPRATPPTRPSRRTPSPAPPDRGYFLNPFAVPPTVQ